MLTWLSEHPGWMLFVAPAMALTLSWVTPPGDPALASTPEPKGQWVTWSCPYDAVFPKRELIQKTCTVFVPDPSTVGPSAEDEGGEEPPVVELPGIRQ
jgi:hypothetical protein